MVSALAALWLMTLGYWALYHGVQRLAALGTGQGGPVPARRDPWAWLASQPIPAAA